MSSRRLALLLALLGGGWASALEAEAPERLVERMGGAVRGLNYTGTLVYVQGDSVETMQLVHRVDGAASRERLTTVSGPQREVICEGDAVSFYLGDERAVLVERRGGRSALPRVLPAEAALLANQYRIVEQGRRTEAGRTCRTIAIAPRDGLRYGYRLCLDEETALPLRTEVLAEDGKRVVEQVVFTSIAFPARISDAELKPRTDAKGWPRRLREPEPAAEPHEPRYTVSALPAGFAPSGSPRRTLTGGGAVGEHHSFSDGLASVSVFVEPADADDAGLDGAARMGATNLYGRLLGDHQVTVVGEVPAATVRAFAEAVALRPEPRRAP